MKLHISNIACTYCHEKLSDWDYRYHGEHYCKKCYNYLFHFKICSICERRRKIYYALQIPICKFCEVKDKPCIRCGKEKYTFGKITKSGAVCSSCAKYFLELKKCTSCGQKKTNISNRLLSDSTTKLLCENCYAKTLPICSQCSYRRKPYTFTIDKRPVCKLCSIEKVRQCYQCTKSFPAGYGNICQDCHCKNTLVHKTNFIAISLSAHLSKIFVNFSDWFAARRGVVFASIHIHHYHAYFFELDELCDRFNRLPSYEELVAVVTIAKTRSNLVVTIFFDEKKLIVIDKKIKEEYANLNMINKYLIVFEQGTYRHKLIMRYYQYLYSKLKAKQTTIRSIRLSLTPAIKFLQYCSHFNTQKPTLDILKGYLWYYSGQRASITGFINFLAKEFNFTFSVKDVEHVVFKSPNTSNGQLKQRFIDLLRLNEVPRNKQNYLFRTAIEYLHGVYIPRNVFIDIGDIKIDSKKEYYIRMGGDIFYLPNILVDSS